MHLRPGFGLGIFLLLAPFVLRAQDDRQMDQYLLDRMVSNRGPSKVNVDAKRVINQSSSFLKEREPEMTGEEYALYEKVVTMLGTNPAFAVKLLEAMMNEKEPPSPAFEFILGNAYYSAGDVDKAAASYQSAVKHYPTFVRAWNNLGVLYYAAGKYEEATPCFSKSITLGDKDPMTFGLLGSCLERAQDYVSAELAYMQALAGDPSSSEWKEGLLRICIQQRQDARAEALVKKLIKDRPDEKRYWLVYANLKLTEGKKLEAITLLETAAGTGIAGPDELTMLGDLYAEEHLTPEALRIYQKLLAASPDAGEHRLLAYARMLTSAGKYAEAKETLDRLEPKVSPANQAALQQARGEWLVAQEKWAEARALFEKILQQAPFNGPALLGVGRSYAAENDLAHAQLSFEAAFKVPESKYAACLELANVELRNRNYRRSVDYLQQALSIERTDAVEDYLARIKSLVSD
ncbi:MAG TPA: tetratricopeptide repeat protein [Candidatus Limnocylindria bacterium]|jgi:tetratricopeptide (TPR) repeat protein|nr:tetratricopeptide repeat protein [Candidatus Limnocylindria bacterium]HTL66737.1 tetratricopeptide repeat protein [Lacunisphaera sp.]